MYYEATWNKVLSFSFLKKGVTFLLIHISRQFFVPPSLRPSILKLCGIKFKDSKSVFIGTDVLFDNWPNTKTEIGCNVVITTGVKIINHYPVLTDQGVSQYTAGDVLIEDNVFIGMNSLIIRPLNIGFSAVIGAGSVVKDDVPDYAIVGGNPAKIIGFVTEDKLSNRNGNQV